MYHTPLHCTLVHMLCSTKVDDTTWCFTICMVCIYIICGSKIKHVTRHTHVSLFRRSSNGRVPTTVSLRHLRTLPRRSNHSLHMSRLEGHTNNSIETAPSWLFHENPSTSPSILDNFCYLPFRFHGVGSFHFVVFYYRFTYHHQHL